MRFSVSRITRRVLAVSISAALLLPAIAVAPVAATDQGCTPGYWKNHTSMWPDLSGYPAGMAYTTSMTLKQAGFVFPAELSRFENVTLLQALQGGGGPGLDGATTILLRAAVASLLNGSFGDAHAILPFYVLRMANEGLASLNRDRILYFATALDYNNNVGCPL